VPRVDAHRKFVVTAQLEVISGKIAKVVDEAVQDVPDAVLLPQTVEVSSDEQPHDTDVPRAEAPAQVGLAVAEMGLTGPVTRGEGS
jgi:hypothetical protein